MKIGATAEERSDRSAAGRARVSPRRRGWLQRHEAIVLTLLSLVAFVAIWQALDLFLQLSPAMFASPLEVGATMTRMAETGELFRHVRATASLFGGGFLIAAALGIVTGLLLGTNEDLEAVLGPYLMALYAAPRVAFMPLLLVWFGVGLVSQITLVFLSALFPIVIATLAGAKSVDRVLLKTARSFGAGRRQVFLKVVLPFAIPSIFAGLRLGIGRGLIGAFVAEMFGAREGLGYLIIRAGYEFRADVLLSGVLVLAALSLLLTEGVRWIGRWIAPWQRDVAL
jgi:ABC-type nitrate/sulfonate/bicarbonate transport system permease component